MKEFISRWAADVTGVLSGFDRLLFRGTLRSLFFVGGMMGYLWNRRILLKDFGAHVEATTERIREASTRKALQLGREVRYLNAPSLRKEDVAMEIARRDGIKEGLVCVLSSVEPCFSFGIFRNRERKLLELQPQLRKCLHYYHYWLSRDWGLMHGRIQTWFPFTVHVCMNGREALARRLDHAGLAYQQRDNCFSWVEDPEEAQRLADEMMRINWPRMLTRVSRELNPAHEDIFRDTPREYYWSVCQSEWATDVMFRSPERLAALYPRLLHHGMTAFRSPDVMRFLGRTVPAHTGHIDRRFQGEVVTDLRHRPEGVRLKHALGRNSIKLYDKQGSVLRVETTINDPAEFKVFRAKEGRPKGKRTWRELRRGVADLHRRARVSQAANQRYLKALAAVDCTDKLEDLVPPICQPTEWRGRRLRGLNPWGKDQALLSALGRGEFAIRGLRNRDLRMILAPASEQDPSERRRQTARTSRLLRLLQAHRLIHKVPQTHRYILSDKAHSLLAALSAAARATPKQLATLVA